MTIRELHQKAVEEKRDNRRDVLFDMVYEIVGPLCATPEQAMNRSCLLAENIARAIEGRTL